MDSNDLNRRLRYALSLDDAAVVDLFRLAEYPIDIDKISAWRLKESDEGYRVCPPEAPLAMLNGLIIQRRGVRDNDASSTSDNRTTSRIVPEPKQEFVDNNMVMKQIRIALTLKTDEVHSLILLGGGKLGKSEVNALFRKPLARNYRRCGDQVLRWFLAGLAKQRKADTISPSQS
ncbi:MAG: DUF1456 family protein [Granulosicoccus sp.]